MSPAVWRYTKAEKPLGLPCTSSVTEKGWRDLAEERLKSYLLKFLQMPVT